MRRPIPLFVMLALWSLCACGKKEQPTPAAAPAAPAAAEAKATPAPTNKLVIVSPHDEAIKRELTTGFIAWKKQIYPNDPAPEIEWQNRGGSVDINKYLTSAYAALGDKQDQGVGIDLYFGGGPPAHEQLKEKNISAPLPIEPRVKASVPATLAGVALRDPGDRWIGVVLSSFGIIYNKAGLKSRNLPEPQTWTDLINFGYFNTLILADPAKSGSARVCYEVILQKYGWEQGWAVLMQIAANTREFASGSDAVPREVGQGSSLAGMCVDYYGYSQIAQSGADVIGYTNPVNATAVTPDPIGMLRGAPNPTLAGQFISFVLEPAGQALFGLKQGVANGPKESSLFRMPILPEFYGRNTTATMVLTTNPYKTTTSFNINEELSSKRTPLIGPLFTAAFLSNKQPLQEAWQAVQKKPELLAQFTAVPFTEAESLELVKRYKGSQRDAMQLDREWQELFRKRYETIIGAAR